MRLQVKGRNVEVSDSIRRYAEEKLGKLDRQLADPTQVELELAVEHNPSIAANKIAEATIWTKGPTLRERDVLRGIDRSARRQARAPGEAVPPEAEPPRRGPPRQRPPPGSRTRLLR